MNEYFIYTKNFWIKLTSIESIPGVLQKSNPWTFFYLFEQNADILHRYVRHFGLCGHFCQLYSDSHLLFRRIEWIYPVLHFEYYQDDFQIN